MRSFLSIILFITLTGCSSIERVSEINNVKLVVGEAVKMDVVDQIGLPNKVERRDGNEYWLYSGRPLRSDLFIPLPVGANQMSANIYQVFYTDIGPSTNIDFKPILVCVFNNENILINTIKPMESK
ncbi:hypothetical protein [Psychromonas aquimarina]|uniref:hypothetical protein n=1 Tax=Psychromonas aquimarina TaxID=444919 RepID=UPI0004915BA8|nr:hypothetical protein [Psychromonas aquimarina]